MRLISDGKPQGPTLRVSTTSSIINLDGKDKNIDKVFDEIKCEKCGGEARVNSHGKLLCKNCAMLVDSCNCNLTK